MNNDSSTAESPSLSFHALCDDTLAHVVSYVDFRSAVRFAASTSKALRNRTFCRSSSSAAHPDNDAQAITTIAKTTFDHGWRDICCRHNFALEPEEQQDDVDYILQCRNRRQLFDNLVGCSFKNKGPRSSLNLPNRYIYFVPIVAKDQDWEDVPPVDFACNSFVLTSTGVGGELLFLDPFDGTLSIYAHCVDNAVKSDEAMMEHAMLDAASAVIRQRSRLVSMDEQDGTTEQDVRMTGTTHTDNDDDEHNIAGDIIDESVYRNHNMEQYHTPPSQVLVDVQDYFAIQLSDYFTRANHNNDHQRLEPAGDVNNLEDDDEIVIDYIGVDSKPILDEHNDYQIKGTMIGVGRILSNEAESFEDDMTCTEMIVWKREGGSGVRFQERLVCRVGFDYHCLEMCSMHNRLYVVFVAGDGPLAAWEDEEMQNDNNEEEWSSRGGGGRTIVAYPLLPFEENDRNESPKYFPEPEFSIKCRSAVSTIVADATGKTLLAATVDGTIEVWETSKQPKARRLTTLNVMACVTESIKCFNSHLQNLERNVVPNTAALHCVGQERVDSYCQEELATEMDVEGYDINPPTGPDVVPMGNEADEDDVDDDDGDTRMNVEPTVPRLNASRTVESIHFPLHLPVEQCGFVSMQHHRSDGTTLLLWKGDSSSREARMNFNVVSLINLPLSAQRKPRVVYDGRRLVVFGQDHIGMIILVYHVLSTWEDMESFHEPNDKPRFKRGDDSAGVRNFTSPERVRFANRIRHAGLGGLEYYDSIYMTCNERFLVVNTKAGGLVGGGGGSDEGLLIIDLEEHPNRSL